jgi:PAS domain S-box-containing protein
MGDPPRNSNFRLGDAFAEVLTETTQSLVCVLDENGRIMLFNDACERTTGFTRNEVLGRPLFESVIPQEEAEAFREVLAFIWRTGHSSPQVGHWQTKDGGRRLIAWSNKPVKGADGVPAYLVTSGIDLTDRVDSAESREPAMEGDPQAKLAEIGRLAQEQRALRRVATLVASEANPERVFMAVAAECARVLEVNASAVWRYEGDDTATIVGRHNRDGIDPFPVGTRLLFDENTTVGRARDTGAPARVDDWGAATGEWAEMMLRSGYRSTVTAPIVVAGTPWGAVSIGSEDRLPEESEVRLGAFCELVSLAVASAQARADLQASRARIVRAGDEQRRKLERNLHDGAQQRLVAAALTVRAAQKRWSSDPESASQLLSVAAEELDAGLEELRELARGLHPGALTDYGLEGALAALATRLPLSVELDVTAERLGSAVEATAYFIVSEALNNVVKHAGATSATVTIAYTDDVVRVEIRDDGAGGADTSAGSGLIGLRDRAEAAGGTLVVVSPRGRGTVVTASLPRSSG